MADPTHPPAEPRAELDLDAIVTTLMEVDRVGTQGTHWSDCHLDRRHRDCLAWRLTDRIRALQAERARAQAAEKALRDALVECRELFGAIRYDWTDPRNDCRAGVECIDRALSATGHQGEEGK